jgi:hypothetical protein
MTQQAKTPRAHPSRTSANGRAPITHLRDHASTPARAACPVCQGRDRIEKVSNIVRIGRGKLVWEDGEISHYETELSELLDEPSPPKQVPFRRLFTNAIPPLLVLAAILGVVAVLEVQTYWDVPESATRIARNIGLAWFGLVIPGVSLIQFVQARLDYRREMPKWVHMRRRWTGLYYCSRDDVVFAPSVNMVAPPSEMRSLLYPAETLTEENIKQLASGGLWEATTSE